jgi:SynChlorMet cassette protein ScmC
MLSDGSQWWLTGVKEYNQWIAKLAAIMELPKCALNSSSKLFFSNMGDIYDVRDRLNAVALSPLTDAGWVCLDYKIFRIWRHNRFPDVICEIKNDDFYEREYLNMWFCLQPIYQRSIRKGGLPLHAGLAELEGRGILLVGPANMGKSTCCRRLPHYWKPLCDDEVLVVLDKSRKYQAHPLPTWSDYLCKRAQNTWNVQYSVPLYGVFFLEQSEGDEVVAVGEGQAAVLMAESATYVCEKFGRAMAREDQIQFRRELFNNASEIARTIPAFILRVSLHGRFWEEIEKVL